MMTLRRIKKADERAEAAPHTKEAATHEMKADIEIEEDEDANEKPRLLLGKKRTAGGYYEAKHSR